MTPFLAIVLVLVHFGLPQRELEFHRDAAAGQLTILYFSFVTRFGKPYVFTLLLGCALIISEATASVFLSQLLPSLAPELLLRIDGRGTQLQQAAVLVALTSTIGLLLSVGGASLLRVKQVQR